MTTTHKAFLGDREREFRLSPKLVEELQRITGVGLGALVSRIMNRTFSYADVIETIRLGLIGGGTEPQEAAALIKAYVEGEPLEPAYLLAFDILSALWFGVSTKDQLGGAANG
ncbi:hypothetical protein A1351_14055 [Methylosinus sp. R-45379]|uniref:gene transfer agent family protein n=1 Tax=Methylosinus sp. R-45379 TaxID=980563 RepID=UPI0007C97FD7|nr:gene transfer agent family protein [Methylosinus sp. R-45379]OAI26962.1 hypothetical protein A1351_14055 [Methylosinus sp. R-45379]